MEQTPESEDGGGSGTQSGAFPGGGPVEEDPKVLGRVLVDLLLGSARLMQVCDEAQMGYHCAEDPQTRAGEAATLSRQVFLNSQKLGHHLTRQLDYPSFQELFQGLEDLPLGYQGFQKLMLDCRNVMQNQKRSLSTKSRAAKSCGVCGTSLGHYDGASCKVNHKAGSVVNVSFHEHLALLDGGLDVADNPPTGLRSRSPSQHKQLEALRIEENMGGAYITHRRRSPRRSPSCGAEGLSPLVSEAELSSIKPLSHSPSHQTATKFLNKLMRRSQPHEGSDSEPELVEAKVVW